MFEVKDSKRVDVLGGVKGWMLVVPSGYEPVSVDIAEFGVIVLCFVRVS